MRCLPLFALALGCASTEVTAIKRAPAKPYGCPLDVYDSEAEVTRPYENLCMIDSTSGRTLFHDRTVRGAIDQARPKACQCGADAVIVVSSQADAHGHTEGTVVLQAIRYTRPTDAAGSTAPASTAPGPASQP